MFNNIDEARTANHAAVGIIDDYVVAMLRKDTLIIQQENTIDELRKRIAALENLVYTEIPEGGEGSI